MTTELTGIEPSPCPACGSPNIVYYKVEGHPRHHFECYECSTFSKCQSTYEEALAAWNRRTPQPTQARAVPLTDEPDCGGECCDCRSYCKKKGGQHGAE